MCSWEFQKKDKGCEVGKTVGSIPENSIIEAFDDESEHWLLGAEFHLGSIDRSGIRDCQAIPDRHGALLTERDPGRDAGDVGRRDHGHGRF